MSISEAIALSERFQGLLRANDRIAASARGALLDYSRWLPSSHIPFFPEYTDHGLPHIESVLLTGEQLIADEALPLLNSADVGAFVIAAILHDVAMHLTEDGFCRLVGGKTALEAIEEFGDKPWPVLWDQFRNEAIRFSSQENLRLFGDAESVDFPKLENPDWTKRQRMLVGEFIRRHHPRLAHQIALHGFPGIGAEKFTLDRLDEDEKNLVGLIARSHGMPLRPCVDHLRRFGTRVEPLKVHAAFLMCLLRIADYLQIQSDRSSMGLRLQSLRSPISKREHDKHLAVRELTRDEVDSEAMKAVVLNIPSVEVYLGLQELFQSIQREIDDSWAVLGEIFGKQGRLKSFGLNIRRLTSTLKDADLLNRLTFEPFHLRFTAANARLFKLLIKPLYGDDANVGVREMVQNSVDAVRELKRYCEHHKIDQASLDLPKQDADIVVDIKDGTDGKKYLVVADKGIGMTMDDVHGYYLTVGASFRESARYRQEFTDDNRRSTVLRTGYFGIGALASFLIGDEIHVSTRHVTSKEGIEFRASIDTDPIQAVRIKRPIGTTIRIPIRSDVHEHWTPSVRFHLREPSLLVCGHRQTDFYPTPNDALPALWQKVPDVSNPIVLWSRPSRTYLDRVIHNGFMIEHGDRDPRVLWQDQSYGLRIFCPHLHIFDPEGNKDAKNYLNLARTEFLQHDFGPIYAVGRDLLRDYMGLIIATTSYALDSKEFSKNGTLPWWYFRYVHFQLSNLQNGFQRESLHGCPWVFTSRGIALLDARVLSELGVRTLLLSSVWSREMLPSDSSMALLLVRNQGFPANRGSATSELTKIPPANLEIRDVELWIRNYYGDKTLETKLESALSNLVRVAEPLKKGGGITLGALLLGDLSDSVPDSHDTIWDLVRAFVPSFVSKDNPSPLMVAWNEFIRESFIPYDEDLRRKKLAHAYEVLAPYIAAWERLLSDSERDPE